MDASKMARSILQAVEGTAYQGPDGAAVDCFINAHAEIEQAGHHAVRAAMMVSMAFCPEPLITAPRPYGSQTLFLPLIDGAAARRER
jgi:hypothetical protein